jgi:hypothetical protein
VTCPNCIAGLDHCHGVLVLHSDGTVECTDPDCLDPGLDRHDLVMMPTDSEA